MNAEKLKKIGSIVRTGGKGSVRRKKFVKTSITSTQNDNALNTSLRRIQLNAFDVDEIKLYFSKGTVTTFSSPSFSACLAANTFVIRGKHTEGPFNESELSELLNPDLNKLIQEMKIRESERGSSSIPASQASGEIPEIPEIEGNFEDLANDAEGEQIQANA